LKAEYELEKRGLAEALKANASDSSTPDAAATLWIDGELWRELDAMLTYPKYMTETPSRWKDIADHEIENATRIVPFGDVK
jgi:hypothetical protein